MANVVVLDFGELFGDDVQRIKTLFESLRSVASERKDLE